MWKWEKPLQEVVVPSTSWAAAEMQWPLPGLCVDNYESRARMLANGSYARSAQSVAYDSQ